MPSFEYRIRTSGGNVTAGVVEATSLSDARMRLQSNGGYILSVTPMRTSVTALLTRLRNVSIEAGPGLKDVRNFTTQLAVMIKAGINIRGALEAIAEQTENAKFRAIIEDIKGHVEAGEPFSEALTRHPLVFSPLYVNMIKAAEMSGNFAHMLERIESFIAQQLETRSMVRGALIYPAIIAVMSVVTTIFMLAFVLPRFTALFAGKEDLLPKPTKMLMATSSILRNDWAYLICALGALIGTLVYLKHTPRGRICFDKLKLRVPLFKRMFRALYITRGLQTMGELINAGVPMLETLDITADVSGNLIYEDMWHEVHSSVNQGTKISQPLTESGLMPKNVVYMIAAGEQSGKLGGVLSDVAEYYSKELRNTIKTVTAMIEPVMIVLMGGVVGFIAMSIILPVFKMSNLTKH
ncbi:MAG: type II secretion system F family protein [Planctomycetes bacterium]|nr:type II secretion system F family protein [Planctomycetota bacterium]